jgi:hypothetical protein
VIVAIGLWRRLEMHSSDSGLARLISSRRILKNKVHQGERKKKNSALPVTGSQSFYERTFHEAKSELSAFLCVLPLKLSNVSLKGIPTCC